MNASLEIRIKNEVIAEVEQQGAQILRQMTQAVHASESINSPSQESSASSASLNAADIPDDPILFDLSSDVIRIKEGSGSYVPLNSSKLIASDLNFYNFSQADTPGILRFVFTLTHINSLGRHEYNYSKTFYGSAVLH